MEGRRRAPARTRRCPDGKRRATATRAGGQRWAGNPLRRPARSVARSRSERVVGAVAPAVVWPPPGNVLTAGTRLAPQVGGARSAGAAVLATFWQSLPGSNQLR